MATDKVKEAADAMFHKLFRLFGRSERRAAADIEDEAMLALRAAQEEQAAEEDGRHALAPYAPAFDCAEDVRYLS